MGRARSQRVMELLAGEATGDLTGTERAALKRAAPTPSERDTMMRIAALAQLAFLRAHSSSPPTQARSGLTGRLEEQAARWVTRRRDPG